MARRNRLASESHPRTYSVDASNAIPVAGPRRAAVAFILVTVLLDVLAFGLVIPVLPHLIEQFSGGSTAQAAVWVGIFGTAFALAQFLCSPIQGALSDRYGRRPVILLSNLGLGLDFLLMALAQSIPVLFLGRVIAGITAASFSTANAYIADVTPPERRAASFGLIGATFGLGFVLGPALGSLLGGIDLRLPFYVAAVLALTNACYGLFILPESLPPSARSSRFDWRRANPLGALVLLKRYRQVLGLASVVFLSNLAHYVLPSVFVLYAGYRYGWGEDRVGYVLALVGVANVLVQAVLVRRWIPRIGEARALLAGLLLGACGFALQGWARSGPESLFAIPFLALWGLAGPSAQSLLSQRVAADEQGRLQGAVASLVALAGIFAPALFSHVFAGSIQDPHTFYLPGAPFFLAASVLVLSAAIAGWVLRPKR